MEIIKFVIGSILSVVAIFDPGKPFNDPTTSHPVAKLIFGIFEIFVLATIYVGLYFQMQNWWKPLLYVLGGYGAILLICLIIDLIILAVSKKDKK